MMHSRSALTSISLAFLALTLARTARADVPPTPLIALDLATSSKSELRVAPGAYHVVLKSIAPNGNYTVNFATSQAVLTPLAPPAATPKLAAQPGPTCAAQLVELNRSDLGERDIPARIAALAAADCVGSEQIQRDVATSKSQIDLGNFTLADGEELIVTVHRASPDRDWSFILTTVGRGVWLTSYGFVFAPDDDDRYFSKATSEANVFLLTKEESHRKLAYAPAIFWSWHSRDDLRKERRLAPTAGVSFDLAKPIALVGVRFEWAQNLALVAGAAMRPVSRIAGQYKVEQKLGENVAPDKLVETTYRPAFFVALTLRFGNNPFGTKAPDSAKGGAATAKGSSK